MKNILKLTLIALLLFCTFPCWALSKGSLTGDELDYLNNTFWPILVKAHICKQADGDCVSGGYIFCNSDETLACSVYGITDVKVIKELFMSMLNSGLKVSYFAFYRSKHHETFFESPILSFTDHTGGK